MADSGDDILRLARKHLGERYVFGIVVPKDHRGWDGPWDCAEFLSWLIYQSAKVLYGCNNDNGDPARADAYTGFWADDARSRGKIISIEQAARTVGAAVLRMAASGKAGHIVVSDGKGGTVEAHSSKKGVISSTLSNRRWDMGILVPDVEYHEGPPVEVKSPTTVIYRWTKPMMIGAKVREIQRKLKAKGFKPGPRDGRYGYWTTAAVVAFQISHGMLPDGEVSTVTANALGIKLQKTATAKASASRTRRRNLIVK